MFFFFIDPTSPPFDAEIKVIGDEESLPTLLDVSAFLYDFNLGYELSRLATDPKYSHFHFSRYALFRNGRPLRNEDRLRIEKLSHSSPIELNTLLWGAPLAIGAIWGIVQIVERISNWKLNRRKLQEEIKKLEWENAARSAENSSKVPNERIPIYTEEEYVIRIQQRDEAHLIDGVTRRLEASAVRIKEMDIRFSRRNRAKPETGESNDRPEKV